MVDDRTAIVAEARLGMHVMHIALGGCLKPSPVSYGITQDTGGHIAYVLGAAAAQVAADPGTRVTIVTRAFDEPTLGAEHALAHQTIAERLCIRRLRTANPAYLTKEALGRELPALRHAFLEMVDVDRPDVVHAHFADAAELALAAGRRFGLPVLYTPHSLGRDKHRCPDTPRGRADFTADERLARETRAIAEADAVIVSSDDEARHQVLAYDPSAAARTVVARPGVSLRRSPGTALASALLDPFLDEPSRPLLLAIARPVPKKNLPRLIEAYAGSAWLRAHANLVVLAGQHERIRTERDEQSGELDAMHELVRRHDLAGRVALPPSHAPETVTELYRLAARRRGLFVNPALHEPFGLTVVEAARFGLPVVATCRGGPRDIVANVGHGRLIDPCDTAGIGDACEALLGDAAAYAAASRSAWRRNALYSWRGWARTVAEVIARRRSPGGAPVPGGRAPLAGAPDEVAASRSSRTAETPPAARRASHFLAFDIDDTLTGCAEGVATFRRWAMSRRADDLPFAVATGRELPEAIEVIDSWRLPRPDVWLTSVGTEIWRASGSGELVRCGAYARRLSEGWSRAAVVAWLETSGHPIRYQAARTQRPWKVSLFGTAAEAIGLAARLADEPLDVRVIASHGRFVDVVPGRAGKAAAIEFEAARHDIPMSRCVAAGNSGNDADMLRRCGQAILVANALPEIADLVDRQGLYRARSSHAHGVLEGLGAFDLLDPVERAGAAGETTS